MKNHCHSAFKSVTHSPIASKARHVKIRIYLLTASIIIFVPSVKDHFRNADLAQDRNSILFLDKCGTQSEKKIGFSEF